MAYLRIITMDYQSTLEWLYGQLPMFSRVGAAAYKPGLDNTIALDNLFGSPHKCFRSIHVGGTNGKGSVSHNLASILQAQGYRTGLYTSPHLVDFRERIRVDGEKIPEEAVVDFIKRFKEMDTELKPSFFELTMMMAFDWFARSEVDIAVVEVGMGGRLDSTNIITPITSIITNISKDHTQFLGDTLPKIAREKAGIIKEGVPVIIGEATGEVRDIFQRKATEQKAPVIFAEDRPRIEEGFSPSSFKDMVGVSYSSPLMGDYQKKNLNTVLTAVEVLRNRCGLPISTESVRDGLKNVCERTGLMGRWMRIHETPLAICDTGHNVAGLSYNFNQLRKMLSEGSFRQLNLLLGFVADKDIDSILRLIPTEARLYLCQASIPRALAVEDLATKCREVGLNVDAQRVFPDVEKGWKALLKESGERDLLYVGGSTFVVADLLSVINK